MADLLPLNIASCIITGFFTKNSLVPIYAQVIYLHVFWGKAICLFIMPIKYQYCNV